MHGEEEVVRTVIFGFDPLWLSTMVLAFTYIVLITERLHRTIVALFGAGIVILSGLLTQSQAIAGIDFNTIALLTGMMIIVSITRQTGLFEFIAIWSAKKVKADPLGILLVLSVVTAVFSAFLDNLTTVLLVVPICLLIVDKLKISPYPFLVSQILASNIGGTATLIGDPPNILIGSATGLTFMDFLIEMGPLSLTVMIIVLVILYVMYGKSMQTTDERKARVMQFEEKNSLTDHNLLVKCLTVLGLVIAGFVIGEHYHIRPGTTAMFGATVLLLISSLGQGQRGQAGRVRDAFGEVEWGALFFFMGLFVVVHGVEASGVLSILGTKMMEATEGNIMITAFATLWISAFVSAAIDNIPFVATMIPLVESMEPALGGFEASKPVWWALAMGACLGGNGSLIGAAANVMVAGLADRAGYSMGFLRFAMIGIPIMLLSIAIANVYLYLMHFM